MSTATSLATFRYEAQTDDGYALSGQIDAESVDEAQSVLAASGLSVLEIERLEPARRAGRLTGANFAAFNQQLAHLTKAGLPIEEGLRLIGQDMPSPRLKAAVQRVVDELESGTPLEQAFETHRDQFPALYGQLIAAGVRTGHLPAVLFSLGRYLQLVQRVRATLWRALAYPAVVMVGVGVVLAFLGLFIVPPMRTMMTDFGAQIPLATRALFAVAQWMPIIGAALIGAVAAGAVGMVLARASGRAQAVIDGLVMPIPLLGPILQRNLAARWCDALRLGVEAGMDLPAAITMAGDITASPKAQADGQALVQTIEAGRSIREHPTLRVVPSAVPAAIHLGAERRDLGSVLADMAQMYHEQAEFRVQAMHTILSPLLLVLLSGFIAMVIGSLFLPLVTLLNELM